MPSERAAPAPAPAEPLPAAGLADVRIVTASPETARRVAEVLRHCFDSTEQRSYPAGRGGGTRLHLTVDTTHPAEPARSWLVASRASAAGRPRHDDEL
ncbi:hypothetical protein GO001_29880 [Streptomyces sp. NRRL B-1677]|uniref:Uncharacterized protein n=1 Tax=Streptomyces klenkii TaxID=1420899 RepID=A0A3B0AP35_9ACTN|nr:MULTISPECIES: hypothetical protein [Streptomyces]MBF6049352.1 hypothetical protein [Streptomyces sp. NRRL B-1677]RKN62011.1 hypothetical protein D7231_31235 [Streptomyces klenkii]